MIALLNRSTIDALEKHAKISGIKMTIEPMNTIEQLQYRIRMRKILYSGQHYTYCKTIPASTPSDDIINLIKLTIEKINRLFSNECVLQA